MGHAWSLMLAHQRYPNGTGVTGRECACAPLAVVAASALKECRMDITFMLVSVSLVVPRELMRKE